MDGTLRKENCPKICSFAHIPYFKINPPIFCCPLFSENYLNPQVRISPEPFLKSVYSTMVAEKFQISSVKITANTFVSQKIESVQFYSYPQAKLPPMFLSLSLGRRELPIPPEQHFLKIFFPEQKEGGSIM